MADKNNNNTLDSEIAKRLDDLFGNGDTPSDGEDLFKEGNVSPGGSDPLEKSQAGSADEDLLEEAKVLGNNLEKEDRPENYPLTELKNLVLSIDWEITDETLASFLSQIGSLKEAYKTDKIILMFLQLLGSLGEYIKTNRGKAHPRTFKILNSVFSRLDDVVQSEKMAESEKKKILRTEMNKYKQLKAQVSQRKTAAAREKKTKLAREAAPMVIDSKRKTAISVTPKPVKESTITYETLAEAIEEIKQYIHSELSAIRQELKLLQKPK